MTNEFYEKLFNVLLTISKNLEPRYFWNDYIFWLSLINVLVLAITLYWLIRYTRATEKMSEYQMTPAIEVNMIYKSDSKTTHLWFSNSSNIPALVSLMLMKDKSRAEYQVSPLRIPPNHPHRGEFRRTGAIDFVSGEVKNGLEVVLKITVTPAIDGAETKICFTKSYRFNGEKSCWDETSWGYPDPAFNN